MKKYIAPSVQMVNIDNENILAGSNLDTADYDGNQTLLGNRRDNLFDWNNDTDEE